MTPNPLLKRLGFSENDRVVIFHLDDIGMCDATVNAYRQLLAQGAPMSASLMVPCPAFPAAATAAREANACAGLHLTLTSEWARYRWKALSTAEPSSGLVGEDGCLPPDLGTLIAHAPAEAVEQEVTAQIEHARQSGLRLTHLDSHMFALLEAPYWAVYVGLVFRHQLPVLLERMSPEQLVAAGVEREMAEGAAQMLAELEASGVPLVDRRLSSPLEKLEDRARHVEELIRALPRGLTHLVFHPAEDTPELRSICDDWQGRAGDLALLRSGLPWEVAREAGIHVIQYGAVHGTLRDLAS